MRRALAGLVLALVLATGGCAGAVVDDPIEFEAAPTTVDEGALAEHGFEQVNESTVTVGRTADVPFIGEREVRITNHVTSYARAGQGESAAGLVVVSTPQARVLGQGVNPLGRVPVRDLVERVGGRAGEQGDVERVGSTTLTVLGTETEVEKFETTTETQEGTVETYVYVTRVEHEGDYVIATGVLPRQFEDAEPDLFAVVEAIEHPAETA